jgi:hypothetical protein
VLESWGGRVVKGRKIEGRAGDWGWGRDVIHCCLKGLTKRNAEGFLKTGGDVGKTL